MKLIIITALIAVCHTAKLDRTYLPPPSAATAGGNHNSLQTPLIKSSENQVAPLSNTPLGSYTNEFEGVIVDAAAPGTRASADELSGLGAPRPSYGSTDSKVGEAAFRGSMYQGQGNIGASDKLERPQASKDRNSNILTYSNDVNPDAYSYGFETDNGIAVGENGIAANGIQAEGGYSYQGDDGQTYKVTYVADEKGYRPQGAHLPTPPPIPDDILKSLQQNAQDEAAGVVDDGSYDAQKYNGDYTHHNAADITHNGAQMSQFGKRPESDTSASGSFINQNNQALRTDRFGSQTAQGQLNQESQFGLNTPHPGLQGFSGSQGSQSQGHTSTSIGHSNGQFDYQTSQFGSTSNLNSHVPQFGGQTQSTQPSGATGSQFGSYVQPTQPSGSQFGAQSQHSQSSASQFGAQTQYTQPPESSGSQFGPQGQSAQSSGSQFGIQAQSTRPSGPQLGAQAQSSQQFGALAQSTHPLRPQFGNQPQFGFPSNIQTKPKSEGLKPTDAAASNRVPQTPNRFGTNNEYLPPSNNIGSKPQFGPTNNFNNGQNQNQPNQNFVLQTQTLGSQQNSGFSTPSGPNNVQSQTPSRPNQFSGNFQSSQSQQFNSQSTPSQSSLNSQITSNIKPTSIPDTELTTPLEPNEVSTSSQSEYNSQTTTDFGSSTPSFGDSTSNFGSSSSAFGSSTSNFAGSKPTFGSSTSSFNGFNNQPSNQFGQSQQFNSQENLASTSQNFPSTAPTPRPQTCSSQFGGSFIKPCNNGRPQYQQNSFSQNQFNQKPDDSYYYNRPSKPFNIPQGSRFPSSPSYQSNVGLNSQFGSQQNSFDKVPGTPVLSPSATQFTQNQGSSTNFNGITQAAISSFPSVSPTSSTQFATTQNNQFGTAPTFTQEPSTSLPSKPQFGQKPTVSQSQTTQNGISSFQTDSQNEPIVQNQQYEGTIYEYNKPAETLPSTQTDSDSSQTIQSNIASSKPEENKPTTSQISPKPTQESHFGQNSFTQSQQANFNQGVSRPQFGLQSNNVPNQFGQSTQFGSQILSQQQPNLETKPFATGSSQTNFGQGPVGLAQQPLGTTGSGYLGYPSAQDSKPQFGSNFGEISQFPTSIGHSQSNYNLQGHKPNQQNLGFESKPQFFQNQQSQFQQNTQFSLQNKPSNGEQSSLGSDSQPFSNMAVFSVVPSQPPKQFVPQTSAQAAVSSEPLDFLPLSKPQNQFNQPSSPQPVKATQPSQFGSQYSSFQGSISQGVSGKGEEFGGPRPPPSFDDKTGYHY